MPNANLSAEIVVHPSLADRKALIDAASRPLAEHLNPQTYAKAKREYEAEIHRLSLHESLRTQIDEAVDRWLCEDAASLVFDDGATSLLIARFYDDAEGHEKFFRFAAAVRSLIRRGIEPTALLRRRCSSDTCGSVDCVGRCGASTNLLIPSTLQRLMAEVKRG